MFRRLGIADDIAAEVQLAPAWLTADNLEAVVIRPDGLRLRSGGTDRGTPDPHRRSAPAARMLRRAGKEPMYADFVSNPMERRYLLAKIVLLHTEPSRRDE